MATKKHNTDAKEVASRTKNKRELKYICSIFEMAGAKLTEGVLTAVMKNLGSGGKLCRSRRKIYIGLKAMGYTIKLKK